MLGVALLSAALVGCSSDGAADTIPADTTTGSATGDTGTDDAGTDQGSTDGGDTASDSTGTGGDAACDALAEGATCDDGNACTVNSTCQEGICTAGGTVECSPGPCEHAMCDPDVGCQTEPAADDTPCNATLACFSSGSCKAGECVGEEKVQCPASETPCIDAWECNPDDGECSVAILKPAGTACDQDEDVCTLDTCDGDGQCQDGGLETCTSQQQNNPCWTWQCNQKTGCLQTAFIAGASCDDGASCTSGDVCTDQQGQKLCIGTPIDGDDKNPCTDDKCTPEGVIHTPLDGAACGDAADPCLVGLCDQDTCEVSNVVDGTSCGTDATCQAGTCTESNNNSDPTCPTWSAGAVAPTSMDAGPAVALFDGLIHVMGGSPFKQHLVLNPAAGTWDTGPELPDSGVNEGAAVVIGAQIVAVDGGSFDQDVKVFTPGTGGWEQGSQRPTDNVRGPAVGAYNGDLLVVGGADGNLNGTTLTHRYDLDTQNWTVLSPMPTARGFIAGAQVDGLVYAIGGRDKGAASSVRRECEAYDPVLDTWSQLADMPTKRNSAMAAAVGSWIVVAGGFTGSVKTDAVEIYDIQSDTWLECGGMTYAFSQGAALGWDGKVLVFGGSNDEDKLEIGTF